MHWENVKTGAARAQAPFAHLKSDCRCGRAGGLGAADLVQPPPAPSPCRAAATCCPPRDGSWPTNCPGPTGGSGSDPTLVPGWFPDALHRRPPPGTLGSMTARVSSVKPSQATPGWRCAGDRRVGVQRANLHHVCRLFDLPAAEAALAVSFYDDSRGDVESALQPQLERALDELDGRRAELGLGPLRRRDVVCTGFGASCDQTAPDEK